MLVNADPIVALFADRVRREREARGWTLRDLAGRAGTDFGRLSRIENKQSCPSLITALTTPGPEGPGFPRSPSGVPVSLAAAAGLPRAV